MLGVSTVCLAVVWAALPRRRWLPQALALAAVAVGFSYLSCWPLAVVAAVACLSCPAPARVRACRLIRSV